VYYARRQGQMSYDDSRGQKMLRRKKLENIRTVVHSHLMPPASQTLNPYVYLYNEQLT